MHIWCACDLGVRLFCDSFDNMTSCPTHTPYMQGDSRQEFLRLAVESLEVGQWINWGQVGVVRSACGWSASVLV